MKDRIMGHQGPRYEFENGAKKVGSQCFLPLLLQLYNHALRNKVGAMATPPLGGADPVGNRILKIRFAFLLSQRNHKKRRNLLV